MQVKKQQLELDIEQQTGSKSEKEYIKALYCHPAYLTYMQSISFLCEHFPGTVCQHIDSQSVPVFRHEAPGNILIISMDG